MKAVSHTSIYLKSLVNKNVNMTVRHMSQHHSSLVLSEELVCGRGFNGDMVVDLGVHSYLSSILIYF